MLIGERLQGSEIVMMTDETTRIVEDPQTDVTIERAQIDGTIERAQIDATIERAQIDVTNAKARIDAMIEAKDPVRKNDGVMRIKGIPEMIDGITTGEVEVLQETGNHLTIVAEVASNNEDSTIRK